MIFSVIGLGYIGLPTAALLASKENQVNGVDTNSEVVNIINEGKIHIIEPGLEDMVRSAVNKGYLKASLEVNKADVFIISVPTPLKKNNYPDLSYIKSAAISISPILEEGNLIILESTSPVGTTEKLIDWLKKERPDLTFPINKDNKFASEVNVAYCPERVLPGKIIYELSHNDRIIGGCSSKCSRLASEIYKSYFGVDSIVTDCRTAELVKLVENSFRDVNIAFANELSLICSNLDINVWELIQLANYHPRVNILQPGPGVGGHCIAVDPWFIIKSSPNESRLIHTARKVNDDKPDFVLGQIMNAIKDTGKDVKEINIACMGLTFKPNVDDLRESPALNIVNKIVQIGFKKVSIVDPYISKLPETLIQFEAKLVEVEKGLLDADIVVMLVDHDIFKKINLSYLSGKAIVDTRGIWS